MAESLKLSEVWKDIDCTNGQYQVSNYGRIRSFNYLTGFKDSDGYIQQTLIINGRPTTKKVHRLVLDVFDGDFPLETVNHKDGNKANNILDNLEWMTRADNTALEHKKYPDKQRGKNNPCALDLTRGTALEILERRNLGDTLKSLSEDFGISIAVISRICRGEHWIWRTQ